MIKARTNNLNKPEDGNYGKQYNYICKDHDISTCFQPGFFDPLSGNFMAGDTVRCIKISNERVVAMAEGIVLEVETTSNARKVEFKSISEITTFPKKPAEEKVKEADGPTYIGENGTVKYNYTNKNWDILVDDVIVHTSNNKIEANSIARGDQPIPVAA
tara:strand:+ start:843 stop:1319 length:477 start_codon:yes stop_codon:yes gene_type:complete